MKKMSKLMALLLVVVMVLMLVPVSAFAAEEVVEEPTLVVLEVEGAPVDEVLNTAVETPVVETPAVEAPAAVEPVVEAPAVETPVAETPVAETPVVAVAEEPVVATAADEGTIEVKAVPALGLWRDAVTFIDVLLNTVGADYSYDAVTNALTLNNFVGKQVEAADMGSNFSMILKGTNVIANADGCAIDVVGNLTMGGSGELTAVGSQSAIHVMDGDLVLNDGDYELFAIGNVGDVAAVDVENGDLIINDGWVDAEAVNMGTGGAWGLWADNDLVINGGDIDVMTDSVSGQSMGIGAGDDTIVKGGYTTVKSTTETGVATALYAGSWVVIRDGILDLCTQGGVNPLAIYGAEGVWISPCYGDVDLTASCLYLEPYCGCHWKHSKSDNPKTGTQDMASDALMATMGLLALMGMAYLISKKEIKG
ncbi:hypothetical protein GH811_02500 [Acetobacterium malicum]|uniref:Carbohydrate-binding domain-containing protein n=1 Tax=Acetobacterium malicum TaxID=52692 RepID=A0ABR6YTH7_9FIRM|nr:hypothetical protein [Acetobacterium malicum]MBC3898487.1 hypothetical protein [Acetobacterium malicum]